MIGSEGANAGARRTSTVAAAAIKGGTRNGVLLLTLLAGFAAAQPSLAAGPERATPSGLPVPRWVSIKVDPARARAGPSEDHRVLWVYHARGMPVQVVAENQFWRRICDPQGGLAWVHSRVVDGRRTVMQTQPGHLALRSAPKDNARIRAYLVPQAVASLEKCKDGWCRVKVGSVEGWAPRTALWGTAEAPLCRASGPRPQAAPGSVAPLRR